MATRVADLDAIFSAMAHPIRRSMLERLASGHATVGQLAAPHPVSLPAISRHLRVLEHAGLLTQEADGRIRQCSLQAAPLAAAFGWLTRYRVFWEDRLDALEDYLQTDHETEDNEA
jgi:DNA-binding transcriptional ArsR family regulator